MSVMSQLHADLETIRKVMEDDMGDEPRTPKEIAEHKVAMAVRDCWLASAELVKLNADSPDAFQFINKSEGDLWSIKLRVDTLIDEIRRQNGEVSLPVIPQFKKVARG